VISQKLEWTGHATSIRTLIKTERKFKTCDPFINRRQGFNGSRPRLCANIIGQPCLSYADKKIEENQLKYRKANQTGGRSAHFCYSDSKSGKASKLRTLAYQQIRSLNAIRSFPCSPFKITIKSYRLSNDFLSQSYAESKTGKISTRKAQE